MARSQRKPETQCYVSCTSTAFPIISAAGLYLSGVGGFNYHTKWLKSPKNSRRSIIFGGCRVAAYFLHDFRSLMPNRNVTNSAPAAGTQYLQSTCAISHCAHASTGYTHASMLKIDRHQIISCDTSKS